MCKLKSIFWRPAAAIALGSLLTASMIFTSCATSQTIKVVQDDGNKKQSTEIETKGSIQSFALVINYSKSLDYGKISQAPIASWTSCASPAR